MDACNVKLPHIVWIVAEDMGPQLGCYGAVDLQTPEIDKLASQGCRFSTVWCTQSVCSPARASLLTGLYPHEHGQIGLTMHRFRLFDGIVNLPERMKKAGYRTGIVGKLHIEPEEQFVFDCQWNDLQQFGFGPNQRRDYGEALSVIERFIDEAGEDPFWLMYNLPDAHLPHMRQNCGEPHDPTNGRDIGPLEAIGVDSADLRECVADYYNCIRRADKAVGELMRLLERRGLSDNTLVVFTSDHGMQFPRGKTTLYEPGLRIPLLLRWPGRMPEGVVIDMPASGIDMMPTVLDAAGLEHADLPGRSLLRVAKEPRDADRLIFAEWNSSHPPITYPQRAVRNRRCKLIWSPMQDRSNPTYDYYRSLPTLPPIPAQLPAETEAAFGVWATPPLYELYDLERDGNELHNMAGHPDYADEEHCLRAALKQWMAATGDFASDARKLGGFMDEADAVCAEYYQANKLRPSNDFQWEYPQYLRSIDGGFLK
ncbi:sulfatase family protein [Paenibacillus koleovorans]|uniref:sulfatase family protein n=1 Tax=Paenibacillus koleovorans TaxID=121608 RepID=UPI000FDA32B3|nr:sulfatase [Paenibacillus koleovorans]